MVILLRFATFADVYNDIHWFVTSQIILLLFATSKGHAMSTCKYTVGVGHSMSQGRVNLALYVAKSPQKS